MADDRYYWLKLKKDFFKRNDIRVIESMPNGKDYVLFYLKLLLESITNNGKLRFSDAIPYDEKMLSVVTNTNVDTVRSAMKVLSELNMVEILDDKTIYMAEVKTMLGSETKWAEKKRISRQKKDNVPALSSSCPPVVRQEIELELDKELDIETETEKEEKKDPAAAVFSAYMDHINPTPSELCIAELRSFVSQVGPDVCLRAIQVAQDERKASWSYVRGILRDKVARGVSSLADWDRLDAERSERNGRQAASAGRDAGPAGRPESGPGGTGGGRWNIQVDQLE